MTDSQTIWGATLQSPVTGTMRIPIMSNANSTPESINVTGILNYVLANLPAGAVTSVSAQNGSLTISPTTGDVLASLNLDNANTWTGQQTFNTAAIILGTATASRALVTDASKNVISSATTATELGYVSGVTSSIQTQLNSKQASGNYITALTGDVTAAGPGSAAATLATVNSNVGSFGSASEAVIVTVNAKGLVTAASSTAIQIAQSQVTNLVSDLALKAPLASPTFTGTVTLPAGQVINGVTLTAAGSASNFLNAAGNYVSVPQGTVTAVSVASANGFAGSSSGGATPQLTLTTSVNGILQGNGTAISAASTTGTGSVVLSDSPVLTTPNIGSATGSISGNAGTATALQTARNINGVSFNGTANITVTAAADTLTGTTLNATVVNSSLTSVGTLTSLDVAGSTSIGGALNMNGQLINNVADPVSAQDAATKIYVDTVAQGLSAKAAAHLATAAALPANTYNNGSSGVGATLTGNSNGALTVDGQSTTAGMRVVVKDESNAAHNGIYVCTQEGDGSSPYILTRSLDANAGSELVGAFIFIQAGDVNASTGWVVTTPAPITIGTTDIDWTQFSGAGTYTAGTGLTLAGTVFSITNTAVSAASYGSSTQIPSFTVNAQGQLTLAANNDVIAPAGTLTGTTLASNVVSSSLTSVGTLVNLTVTNPITGSVTGNAATATALQTPRTIGGVSFNGTANITVASATGGFTVSGGDLAVGANNITCTGSLGSTGSRLTKGWFTDLEVTNAIAGSITGTAAVATTVTAANEATDTTCFLTFVTAATGSLGIKTNTNLIYNSNTGALGNTGVFTNTGAVIISSNSATALTVGPNGATNPALTVAANTGSMDCGITITGGTASATVATTGADTDAQLILSSKGDSDVTMRTLGTSSALNFQINSSARLSLTNSRAVFTPTTSSTAGQVRLSWTGAANTNLTGGAEFTQVHLNVAQTNQHASNTAITTQRDVRIDGMNHSYASSGGVITNVGVLALGWGNAGTNCTITHNAALYIPTQAITGTNTNAYAIRVAAPTGATNNYAISAAGTSELGTVQNTRINPRVVSTASSGTPTPDADITDEYVLTALAADATFGAPTGTPVQGQAMMIRIKDDATPRALSFNAIYRAIGVTLPTTTVASKTMYIGMIYNSTDTKWDVLSVSEEA